MGQKPIFQVTYICLEIMAKKRNEIKENSNFELKGYEVLRLLAQGGMGEVYLVKDLSCGRVVALKKMRDDYLKNETLRRRFLKEAHLTAQLSHPSIIPVYSLHTEGAMLYYTMPYVEGETLSAILKATKREEEEGKRAHPVGSSIPALMRIFLQVCEAIGYAHSRKILHRDIKPENIIIGKFGEVLLLDWGLIDTFPDAGDEKEVNLPVGSLSLTKPGKIAGTLAYLAPERALGKPASFLTDIYSLGVLLYQLLTLKLPFHRPSLSRFRKEMQQEVLIDPSEAAPYRDIPRHLAMIAIRCLCFSPHQRFQSVEALLEPLKHYVEGRFEWIEHGLLHHDQKEDWEFQENILLAKNIAITNEIDEMEWVYLMVSREAFSGNTQLKTFLRLKEGGKGIGLLLCIPEAKERKSLEEGYSLWLSGEKKSASKLFRNNVEVLDAVDVSLKQNKRHQITLEKIENNLYFYLDGELKFRYLSHLPLRGTHIGLLFRDTRFEMEPLSISLASHNATINCLSVPDAFFAARQYTQALLDYRKIGTSFSGRTEGREALFRAGVTLLEKGKTKKLKRERERLFSSALEEFGKLHATPAAPLEYLGKALVYHTMKEVDEEVKCLELALRKYPKHPLLPPLEEEVLFRLHETADHDRKGAYHFALLTLRFLPHIFRIPDHQKVIDHLTANWDPLPFLDNRPETIPVALAFWLAKPLTLLELGEQHPGLFKETLFALLELGCSDILASQGDDEIQLALSFQEEKIEEALEKALINSSHRLLCYLFRRGVDAGRTAEILPFFSRLKNHSSPLKLLQIEALLFENKREEAKEILSRERLDERSPFFPSFGAFLAATEGPRAALAYLRSLDTTLTSLSLTTLLSYYLKKRVRFPSLFPFEKMQLLRQLTLFSHCAGEKNSVKLYRGKLKKEIGDVQSQAALSGS
ncbi:MAG TPA: serine/threonine protein kinase [Parachlamydiales bacterium]|nr:serine/threonine protein kinase [Parachlamydiales bacterium]